MCTDTGRLWSAPFDLSGLYLPGGRSAQAGEEQGGLDSGSVHEGMSMGMDGWM